MPHIQYETVFDPSQEDLAPIDRGFHEFNLAHLGEKIIYNYYKVMIVARDEDGAVIGDLSMDPGAATNAETVEGGNIVVPHTPKRGKNNQVLID